MVPFVEREVGPGAEKSSIEPAGDWGPSATRSSTGIRRPRHSNHPTSLTFAVAVPTGIIASDSIAADLHPASYLGAT